MMTKILIPTPLRRYVENRSSVTVDGSTVGEVLANLTSRYRELAGHLYDEAGALRSFVNIYVNDEDIRTLERERTVLGERDVVSIVPAMAGG